MLEQNKLIGFLKIPQEHGAVVSFVLSTLLALRLACPASIELVAILAAIWIVFCLQHRPPLALYFGLASALVLSFICKSVLVLVLVGSFATGGRVLAYLGTRLGASWRETFGMLGLGVLPLLAAMVTTNKQELGTVIALAYSAASVMATAMIHILRRDRYRTWQLPILVGALLLVWLWAKTPFILVMCLAPFIVQLLWLLSKQKPSFAQLGILETISMSWVFLVLWLWVC